MSGRPLVLHAEVTRDDDEYGFGGKVVVMLGSYEVAAIPGADCAWHGGVIDVEETAARWLRDRLATPAEGEGNGDQRQR